VDGAGLRWRVSEVRDRGLVAAQEDDEQLELSWHALMTLGLRTVVAENPKDSSVSGVQNRKA